MNIKLFNRNMDLMQRPYIYLSSDVYRTVSFTVRAELSELGDRAAKVTAQPDTPIGISDTVKWYGAEASVKDGKCTFNTVFYINGANFVRGDAVRKTMNFCVYDKDGEQIAADSVYLVGQQMPYSGEDETASVSSSQTRLPLSPTCRSVSLTPTLQDIIPASVTYEIEYYGNITDTSCTFTPSTNTAAVHFCPLFYSNRHEAKWTTAEEYTNMEMKVTWYGISETTGVELTGSAVYYMPHNYVYYQDIIIESPVKLNYDVLSTKITPYFIADDYTFESVSVVHAGAVTKAVKTGNDVTVTTETADTEKTAILRFAFTSGVFEPYTFYYDIDVIKQAVPEFTVFNSNDNYTLTIPAGKWSCHIGTAEKSVARGKTVAISGSDALLQLENICTLEYPSIDPAVSMSTDETHKIAWTNSPKTKSSVDYRIENEGNTIWLSPRYGADGDEPVHIILSSDTLYRTAPFYITYNTPRGKSNCKISLTVWSAENGKRTAVWVKKDFSPGPGVTQYAYEYWGGGDSLVFNWTVTDGEETWSMTETASLKDTCRVPYIVYWTGDRGAVMQQAFNECSKEKVTADFSVMSTPYYADGVTKTVKKKWKSQNTASLSGITDYLDENEMSELKSLFTSLSVYVYDCNKRTFKPVTVTDKSFTVSTFDNNGRKYANAAVNLEYAESTVRFN